MEEQTACMGQEMPEAEKPMWKHAITYGLYYAALSIVISVIAYMTGTITAQPLQWISTLIMIVAVVLIQLHYRKTLGGYISYGQSLGIAVLSLLMAAVPIAIYTWCLYTWIDPGLLEQIRLTTEEQLVGRGMSEEQISATMAFSSKFQTPAILAFSQFFNLPLTGVIIGLISSIFVKKQSPDNIFD
jgi:heme/copper-type cytochrome/quinol oxidase subunit 4